MLVPLVPAPGALAAPGARDFSQPLGEIATVGAAHKHSGESGHGPVTHRSAAVRAPQRFQAVGLAAETRPLEIRVRSAAGAWSEWIEIGAGDPLYAVGGARWAQLRTRGWRPRGRLHYVAVTAGEAQAKQDAGAKRKRGVAKREGEPPRPRMVRRRAWGADTGCVPRSDPVHGRVKAVAVHHTVTSNDYARSEAKAIVLAICRYHRNANGWNDIGYNALVDRFGRLYEGRAGGFRKSIVGAHAQGYNSQTAGVASIANHTSVPVSLKAKRKISRYAAWKLAVRGLRASGRTTLRSGGGSSNRYPAGTRIRVRRIVGHRDLGYTACPGDRLYPKLPRIREKAQKIQDNHAT